ncbi:hypothetical protein M1O18_05120 [Dehalococcoidia bacterium]|nr:hypothetical protein [Dehalococcoidia bacterium]MCL0080265.1 hypothetical protein [Dehalococcoidia bacterium]
MRSHITVISIVELMLIAALSGSGTYAFINSGIYSWVKEFGEAVNLPIYYIPIILWGLLSVVGVFNITFRGGPSDEFVQWVALLSLPSLLSYNTVDWLGIFAWVVTSLPLPPTLSYNIVNWLGILGSGFNTGPGFYEMLGLGVLIITGYVVLNHLHIIKQARHNLANRGANPVDMESVTFYSYLVLILAIVGALVTAAAIAFLSRNLELLMLDHIRDMPWNVVFIGLSCILLLAGYLYWLGAQRRPKDQSSD